MYQAEHKQKELNMQKHSIIVLALLVFSFAGCSSTPKEPDLNKTKVESMAAQELFDGAKRSMRNGNYVRATELLEEIDTRYPFGRISEQAKLELIYAYFKRADYESGQALADRFLRQHPQHENADYVYYMKGVMHYEQEVGTFKEVFSADIEKRDTSNIKAAFDNFKALVEVYPESEYAPDARKRMIQIRNLLADYELHVARYYMQRDSYIGAANRAKYIVENFPKTPAVPSALEILINSYKILELPEISEEYRKVLLLNYPDYKLAEF
ncbi:outer membrane assembly lipoprotein YfiO [Kangiella koreensis DSM 16069]|uniref:Outer membrane protein assembly factor BamD n=2 Tax=Kangiella TaxID=261963 RepID=C7RB58_KANKD|nr:outer membrane assembly lipoprotein YfiO [Kangiella koreensis DSM 16069]